MNELTMAQERVKYLERVVAFEARVIEAQALGVKSLAFGRRRVLERSVDAMRNVVRQGFDDRYAVEGAWKEYDALKRRGT